MKILITGAAGFLASNLWGFLEGQGHKLSGWDAYTYAANKDLAKDRGITCLPTWDKAAVDFEFRNFRTFGNYPDLAINGASETHVDNSLHQANTFLRANVEGTLNITEACMKYGIPMVHISSDETIPHEAPLYDPKKGIFGRAYDANSLIEEGWEFKGDYWFYRGARYDRYDPSSPYSASKVAAEAFVRCFKKLSPTPMTIVRPCNQYGPYQHPEKMISRAITQFLQDKPMGVYGKGEQWRDYMYVSDFCRAISSIIDTKPEAWQDFYHIAAEDERQNKDVVGLIAKKLDKEHLIQYIEDPRPGHDYCYSMACDLKGFTPLVEFEEGIDRTIQYYKEKLNA